MKFTSLRLLAAGILLAALPALARAQLVFTVTATANSTALGYTSGQSATFSFTLHDFASATPHGTASTGTSYIWTEDALTDPELWSVSGTRLTGTWTRPNASGGSPLSSLEAYSTGRLKLYASLDTGTTGMTVNGVGLLAVTMDATYTGLNFSGITGSLPDPATYLTTYQGTYTAASSAISRVWDTSNNFADFTVTGVTIGTAVPEPSTYAACAGVLALGVAFARRRRQRDLRLET